MSATESKRQIAKQLQQQINALQGLGRQPGDVSKATHAPFEAAFPDNTFPVGTIHEFLSYEDSQAACTNAFIVTLISTFIGKDGYCLWIGRNRKVFPGSLAQYGISPHKVMFVDLHRQKDLLWAIEEALKCDTLTAVVGEICELGFSESRRLQLAVERSKVTGFIHRHRPESKNSTACTARWHISSAESISAENLPGVGHQSWNIELLKVRNGKPGIWKLAWIKDQFQSLEGLVSSQNQNQQHLNAG
ncbi:MAG: Error-prone repair protein ImuA [Chitinophagaceae bacterium]|nr:MAG: Error-prone repair protein ImuA [Chitinophagaceae bacterium]